MNSPFSMITALLTLAALLQGIVAFIELKRQTGRPKIWITSTLVCVVLAIISGYTSYTPSSQSDTSISTNTNTQNTIAPSPTPTMAAPTPTIAVATPTITNSTSATTDLTPTPAPQVESWTGTSIDQSSLIYTRYAELHVASVGPGASFQGTWCEDYTNKTDLYGHDECTNSISISGTWIAFSKLGAGLQTDINNKYPYTTHNTIIIWSEQGSLDQSGRSYAFVQNNVLKGLGYAANGAGPYSSFNLTLQGGGTSKLGI